MGDGVAVEHLFFFFLQISELLFLFFIFFLFVVDFVIH